MDRALKFHRNTDVTKENIRTAEAVSIDTDYDLLRQAADYDLLRCLYANCLQPLIPVREEGSYTRVSHFAHRFPANGAPYCPYRTLSWSDAITTATRISEPVRHKIRKLVESHLYEQLSRKFPAARITMSDDKDREPRIQIDGLARPLLILSIAPRDESLWREPFDGTMQGREVLFFIVAIDIPYLNANVINQKLLAKSSAITVDIPTKDREDFTFKIPGEISGTKPITAAPLDQLDLIYVNYQNLFGLNRAPEYLFIKTPEKSPIELVEQQLKSTPPSLKRKLLQLLAKRLLVDSTRVHQIVFQQIYSDSQQFFHACNTFPEKNQLIDFQETLQLQRETATEALFKEKALQPLYSEFFLQAASIPLKKLEEEKQTLVDLLEAKRKELQGAINKLEGVKKTQTEQFEMERKQMQGSIKKLEESNQKLTLQLEETRRQREDESYRWKQLEAESGKQIAEIQKSQVALRERLHTRNKELDNEQKRRQKLENDLKTLQQGPLSRWALKYYKIEPN